MSFLKNSLRYSIFCVIFEGSNMNWLYIYIQQKCSNYIDFTDTAEMSKLCHRDSLKISRPLQIIHIIYSGYFCFVNIKLWSIALIDCSSFNKLICQDNFLEVYNIVTIFTSKNNMYDTIFHILTQQSSLQQEIEIGKVRPGGLQREGIKVILEEFSETMHSMRK